MLTEIELSYEVDESHTQKLRDKSRNNSSSFIQCYPSFQTTSFHQINTAKGVSQRLYTQLPVIVKC